MEAINEGDTEEIDNFPVDFLHQMTPNGLPPHDLNLKVGAIVMLIRNLSVRQGLCNGTRLRIISMSPNLLQAEILLSGKRVFIPRIPTDSTETGFPFKLKRLQFPLRLSYAMTINKAQGE